MDADLDPYQLEKWDLDPDPYQLEKWDPDPHQNVLDPPHCFHECFKYLNELSALHCYSWCGERDKDKLNFILQETGDIIIMHVEAFPSNDRISHKI